MKPTSKEARQLAFFLYPSSVAASVVAGAVMFYAIAIAVLSDPLFLFPATLVGAVFGWHLILPLVGQLLAKNLDEKLPGLAAASIAWVRNATPGESLDIGKLSTQISARANTNGQPIERGTSSMQ